MTKQQKEAIAAEVKAELEAIGYQVMYGGRKGHGFWVKGLVLPNPRSGNPNFATIPECRKAIAIGKF